MSLAWVPYLVKERWKQAGKMREKAHKLERVVSTRDGEGWEQRNPLFTEEEYAAVLKIARAVRGRANELEGKCD